MKTGNDELISLHDPQEISQFLRRDVYLHLYSLGDLDPFFWPKTVWYGLKRSGELSAVFLLYTGNTPPTLLALDSDATGPAQALAEDCVPFLPPRMYGHVSPGILETFSRVYRVQPRGSFLKMALVNPAKFNDIAIDGTVPLTEADSDELKAFYSESYSGNWFDSRMLQTGFYYGIRDSTGLQCVAGIHVYSAIQKVAALGNIATRPSQRGKGLATRAVARLCRELLHTVEHIGLNVKLDNHAAIACYSRLGFEPIAQYDECFLDIA